MVILHAFDKDFTYWMNGKTHSEDIKTKIVHQTSKKKNSLVHYFDSFRGKVKVKGCMKYWLCDSNCVS